MLNFQCNVDRFLYLHAILVHKYRRAIRNVVPIRHVRTANIDQFIIVSMLRYYLFCHLVLHSYSGGQTGSTRIPEHCRVVHIFLLYGSFPAAYSGVRTGTMFCSIFIRFCDTQRRYLDLFFALSQDHNLSAYVQGNEK